MELFPTTFLYILKLFGLSVLGYVLFKIRALHGLYRIFLIYTVDIALPLFILDRLVLHLKPVLLKDLNYIMLISAGLVLSGLLLGKVILKITHRARGKENLFLAILGFSNVGYLPLPLMEAIFHGQQLIEAQIYILLFIIPFNLLIWSIGVPLSLNERISLKKVRFTLTMPFIFVVLSLFLGFFLEKSIVPGTVQQGMEWVAWTVNPSIMVMLGGAFSEFNLSHIQWNKDTIVILVTKLIIFPLLAFPFILWSHFNEVLKMVLLMEAAVPPAVNLVIINKRYGQGRNEDNLIYLLSSLVSTYLFSIFSIPLIMSLFRVLVRL